MRSISNNVAVEATVSPKVFFKLIFFSFVLVLSLFSVKPVWADDDNVTLNIGGATIDVFFAPGVAQKDYKLSRKEVVAWIERSAHAVTKYFHRFPVKSLRMAINDGAGSRVNGTAYHGEVPLIMINISESFDAQFLTNDWVMVHEMVHLSFPPVVRRHNWLLEGLATYVEPVVRVRAGLLKEDEAWKWLINGTPQGLPRFGNRGLDNTPTWGQTYWGGAIFFLVADMRIHQQTNNKFGIEHALRAIQKNGGSMQLEHTWQVDKALKIGDKATGTQVLMTLYNEMKDKAVKTDLEQIWRDLGVSRKGNKTLYNDNAPLAQLRRSIYQE